MSPHDVRAKRTAGDAIRLSMERFSPVHGAMAVAMVRRRPVSRETLQGWANRLRAAADELDRVLK